MFEHRPFYSCPVDDIREGWYKRVPGVPQRARFLTKDDTQEPGMTYDPAINKYEKMKMKMIEFR